LVSVEPWFRDDNHAGGLRSYGIGSLYIVAAACLKPNYDAARAQGAQYLEWVSPIGDCIDLTDDIVTIKTGKLPNEPPRDTKFKPDKPQIAPRLFFFFQTGLPVGTPIEKQFTASYGFNKPIELWHQEKPTRLNLSSDPKDWFPFGASAGAHACGVKGSGGAKLITAEPNAYPNRKDGRLGGYGCAKDRTEFEQCLSHVTGNLGFMVVTTKFPAPPVGTNSPKVAFPEFPMQILFERIEITHEERKR